MTANPAKRRYAVGISYRGCVYYGWQSQKAPVPTVQSYVEKALARVADEPIAVQCAGRTDRGVHASYQVIHFDTVAERSIDNWCRGVQSNLPADIRVLWVQPVNDDFHARFTATARHYVYVIDNAPHKRVLWHQLATAIEAPLDVEAMQTGANHLLGKHDFSSFRHSQCQANSPIRQLYSLSVERRGNFVFCRVHGSAFLYHMVRNIMGVLVPIGLGEEDPDWSARVLACRDRRQAGLTMPPDGLVFCGVDYGPDYALPAASDFDWWA